LTELIKRRLESVASTGSSASSGFIEDKSYSDSEDDEEGKRNLPNPRSFTGKISATWLVPHSLQTLTQLDLFPKSQILSLACASLQLSHKKRFAIMYSYKSCPCCVRGATAIFYQKICGASLSPVSILAHCKKFPSLLSPSVVFPIAK